MRYNIIRKTDISNGPGVRVSLFTQGCFHKCENCFNPETWNMTGGKVFSQSNIDEIISLLDKDHIRGLSILGGDPLIEYDKRYDLKNDYLLLELVKTIKKELPNKDIWLWTGYVWEDFFSNDSCLYKEVLDLIKLIDIIVDGEYIDELYDIKLQYRGSSNQRVIDVQKSINEKQIIEFISNDRIL